VADPNVLAGLGKSNEDACVYKISDDVAVVGTLDFFTPVVDEPEAFGRIAAANALSDVYAMGAKPIFALNIVGFPSNRLPPSVLARILQGGQEKCAEAGIAVLGGHTVEDLEPKYGLCVIGVVDPKKFWRNNALQAGDQLVLTKPIGTGVLGTAHKIGRLEPESYEALVENLQGLNRKAAEAAQASTEVHAATDVTGFGLLGHLREMLMPMDDVDEHVAKKTRLETNGGCASTGRLGAVLSAKAVPLLPQALELAVDSTCIPGGSLNNLKLVESAEVVRFSPDVPREMQVLLADAQTSGGLLFAVPERTLDKFIAALKDAGLTRSAVIGHVRALANATEPAIQVDF